MDHLFVQSRGKSTLATDRPASLPFIRRRLKLLKTLVPSALVMIVVAFELGPARWIHNAWGAPYHFAIEILIYGTVGPVLTVVAADLLQRWLEERETTEVQARVLAGAREQASAGRQSNESALQTLFAANLLLRSIESSLSGAPPDIANRFADANRALERAIHELQAHQLAQSESPRD